MKTVLGLIVLAAAVTWGWPAITLSDNAAIAYLDELEALSMQGHSADYCERMHEDLTVAVEDSTSELAGTVRISGGRKEWCAHVAYATKGLELLAMQTQAIRSNVDITRRWSEPWTARVSYDEERTSTFPLTNSTLQTESSDRWTLVNTFSGVKVLSLESKSGVAR